MIFFLWLIWTLNFFMVSADVASSPPVLIWGMKTPASKTIFRAVKIKQFYLLMKKIREDHMIVIYLASKLAAKDLNCEPCFSHLKEIKSMNYYSQVEEPLRALQKVVEKTNGIIWHQPMILNQTRLLSKKMQMPCQPGQIHAFDFTDRNFEAHDHAMGVSTDQLGDCPAVHVYTAFKEENQSYLRRRIHTVDYGNRKPQYYHYRSDNLNTARHLSFVVQNGTKKLTILRREEVIIAFNRIILATKESVGNFAPILRINLTLLESNYTMQLGKYNKPDLDEGFVIVLDTNGGPLLIEVLPIKGNWYITRMFLDDTTFYATDLIFFSSDFSLCCNVITFFSKDKTLLSIYDFYLDIITSPDVHGMQSTYEAKPCWNCAHLLTPTLTHTLIVMFLFIAILVIGTLFITSIGSNKWVQVAAEPDLYIKTDQ